MYDSLRDYNQAKKLHEKALTIYKKIFGKDHANVVTSYTGLADVYDNLEDYNQAKGLHEETLIIRKKIFGENHGDVYQQQVITTWQKCTSA